MERTKTTLQGSDEFVQRFVAQFNHHLQNKKQILTYGFQIGEIIQFHSLLLPKGGWAEAAHHRFINKRDEFVSRYALPGRTLDVLWYGIKLNMLDDLSFGAIVHHDMTLEEWVQCEIDETVDTLLDEWQETNSFKAFPHFASYRLGDQVGSLIQSGMEAKNSISI